MPVTNYLWDPETDTVLLETDGNNAVQVVYTTEPVPYGNLISQHRGGATSYYHQDALGSTLALTDEDENVTDEYVYSAYGETVAQTGSTPNPFRWLGAVGYYYDQGTGDYYVRARNYSPRQGRWTSFDPLLFVDGINLYRPYFIPANRDPGGHSAERACSGVLNSFSLWLNTDKTAGDTWLATLPHCPCELVVMKSIEMDYWFRIGCYYFWESEYEVIEYANPDDTVWDAPAPADQEFHPGAEMCMRTRTVKPSGPGQQCCYDKDGKLITHGQAAGTPDRYGPDIGTGVGFHYAQDVQPYNWAVFLEKYCSTNVPAGAFLDMYWERRPISQGRDSSGNPCAKNP